MLAGVAAVITNVVITMVGDLLKQKRLLPILILFNAFIASRFLNVNIVILILICGTIGAIDSLSLGQQRRIQHSDLS